MAFTPHAPVPRLCTAQDYRPGPAGRQAGSGSSPSLLQGTVSFVRIESPDDRFAMTDRHRL